MHIGLIAIPPKKGKIRGGIVADFRIRANYRKKNSVTIKTNIKYFKFCGVYHGTDLQISSGSTVTSKDGTCDRHHLQRPHIVKYLVKDCIDWLRWTCIWPRLCGIS